MKQRDQPGNASSLHVIGQCDVIGPDVKLPFVDAQDAAQDGSRVDAYPHVQVHLPQIKMNIRVLG